MVQTNHDGYPRNLPLSLFQHYPSTTPLGFETYVTRNCSAILHYAARYRQGKIISTAFVESAVNQVVSKRFVKKQQMRWSDRGAHLLLQVRTHVLNGDWRSTLSRWFPKMKAA